MKWLIGSAAVIVVAAAGTYWYVSATDKFGGNELPLAVTNDAAGSADEPAVDTASPFAVSDDEDTAGASDFVNEILPELPSADAVTDAQETEQMLSWHMPLSDEQFRTLVAQLKSNPELLQQLVDDFRQETDPSTKEFLIRLLGKVGGEQTTLLASELIFSGDNGSRALGMSLLQQAPGNADSRDIVSGMLSTEIEPRVLINALTALSKPGDVDPQSRAYLSDQIALLASHQSGGVRSVSLDILSRWSDDGRYTDVLLSGLDDSSEYVRSAAAYALADSDSRSTVIIERLLTTLRNTNEVKRVKRAAIVALRYMPVTLDQASEIETLERQLNTVAR